MLTCGDAIGKLVASRTIHCPERWVSVKSVFQRYSWVSLAVDPQPEGRVLAVGPNTGGEDGHPCAGVAGSGFCMCASGLCVQCCSPLVVWFSFFPLCHFVFFFSHLFSSCR